MQVISYFLILLLHILIFFHKNYLFFPIQPKNTSKNFAKREEGLIFKENIQYTKYSIYKIYLMISPIIFFTATDLKISGASI